MGSIQVEDLATGPENGMSNSKSIRKFEIPGLKASIDNPTPTNTREDLILLSWLIVLLRTREGTVNFDWTYLSREDGVEQETRMRCLKMEQVMPGVECKVEEARAAISRYIEDVAPRSGEAKNVSLLLSSVSLADEEKEVSSPVD